MQAGEGRRDRCRCQMVSKGLTPASDQPLTPALPTQPRSSLGSYHRCPLITLDKYPSIHTESRIDELRRSHLECFGSNPLIATDFGSNPLLDRAPGPAGDAQVAGAVHGSTSSVPCWRGPGAQTKPAGVTNAQTQTRPNQTQTKTKTKPNPTQPKPKPKPKPKPNPNQTQTKPAGVDQLLYWRRARARVRRARALGGSAPEDGRELSAARPWRPGRASAHEDADAL